MLNFTCNKHVFKYCSFVNANTFKTICKSVHLPALKSNCINSKKALA